MPTQKEIGDHLGINQSEVSRHMQALNLEWKVLSMAEIRLVYITHLRTQAAGHKSGDMDLIYERVLTERVDRELKEYNLAEKKGQLINIEELEPRLMQLFTAFRSELLSRDEKLRDELNALHDIDVDITLLNAHTNNALEQFAQYGSGDRSVDHALDGDTEAA